MQAAAQRSSVQFAPRQQAALCLRWHARRGRVEAAAATAAAARSTRLLGSVSGSTWVVQRWVCHAGSTDQVGVEERARRAELVKGVRTVLAELTGLDFPRLEVARYLARAVSAPPKYPGFDVSRAAAALDALLAPAGDSDGSGGERTTDTEALVVLNAMLSDIWRWRRRGGFGASDEDAAPHVQALQALQGVELTGDWVQDAAAADSGERVTSSLLDSLPLSDDQKTEMSSAVQQAALGAINGAVWGSLVAVLVALVIFNFIRSG